MSKTKENHSPPLVKCRKSPCSPAAASICCWGWGSQPPRVLSSQPQVEPWRRRSSSKKKNQTLKGEHLPVSPERPGSSVPPAPRAQPHSLQDRARPSGNGARGAWETPGGTSGTWTLPRFWARTKPQGAGNGCHPAGATGPFRGGGTSGSNCGQVVQLHSSVRRRPAPFSPSKDMNGEALCKGQSDPHHEPCHHCEGTWPWTLMFGAPESNPPKVSPKGTLHPASCRTPGPPPSAVTQSPVSSFQRLPARTGRGSGPVFPSAKVKNLPPSLLGGPPRVYGVTPGLQAPWGCSGGLGGAMGTECG